MEIMNERDKLINMIKESHFNYLDGTIGDLKISIKNDYNSAIVRYELLHDRAFKFFYEFCNENYFDIFINDMCFTISNGLYFEREGSCISCYNNKENMIPLISVKYEDIKNIYAIQIVNI